MFMLKDFKLMNFLMEEPATFLELLPTNFTESAIDLVLYSTGSYILESCLVPC